MRHIHSIDGRIAAIGLFLLVGAGWVSAQEPTALRPVAPIAGEDPATLKMIYERWAKRPKVTKVSGTVVNENDKPTPVAKLIVSVDYGVRLEGKADAEGRFQFEIPDTHLSPIYGEALDGAMSGVSEQVVDRRGGKPEPKVVLYPSRDLTFTIRNAAGAPASHVHCGAFMGLSVIARGRSDDKGVATLRIPEFPLPLGGAGPGRTDSRRLLILYGFSDEHGLGVEAIQRVEEAPEYPNELRLTAPKPLKVKVADRDGKPLSDLPVLMLAQNVSIPSRPVSGFGGGIGGIGGIGGSVGLMNVQAPCFGDGRGFVKTNAAGEAELKWFATRALPEEAARSFGGRTASPTAITAIHPEWPFAMAQVESEMTQPKANIVLYSPATIRGRVTLPSGEPAAGIKLASRTINVQPARTGGILTNEKGEFEIVANVDDPDYFINDSKWVADRIQTQQLVRSGGTKEIEIKLREGKRVQFKVTSGPEFRPVDKQLITIAGGPNSESGFGLSVTTDAEGHAEVTLDRGLYSIDADTNGEGPLRTSPTTLLVKDQPKIEVPLHIDMQTPRSISLSVKKPDGITPAIGAKIERLTTASSGRPNPADRGAFGGRAAAEGMGGGGFGGGGRRATPAELASERGLTGRGLPAAALITDANGVLDVKVAAAADTWLLITGAESESALVKVDVLKDSVEAVLRPSVKLKGRLIDQATGEPIVGATLVAPLDTTKVRAEPVPGQRGGFTTSASNRATTSVVTNAKGEFELTTLIADAPYMLYLLSSDPVPGGIDVAERFGAGVFGSRQLRITSVTTPKEGSTDLGDIKTKTPPAPPRPQIPNDPNAQ